MEKYNYYSAIRADIERYLDENEIELNEDTFEDVYDELWDEDSVTGNGSGSYWMSTWDAEEALCHNFDTLIEAMDDLGYTGDTAISDPEGADVLIRCYMLRDVLSDLLFDQPMTGKEVYEYETYGITPGTDY